MALTISDFSAVTGLPTQTLRYYHAEGLLVPAEVDERTGYRSYAFAQVERAALVGALRRAGIGVKDVRAAAGDPEVLRELLQEHQEALHRRREREDAALAQARALVGGGPRVEWTDTPPTSVVTLRVPGRPPSGETSPGEEVLPGHVSAAARDLATALRARGVDVLGDPWCTHLLDTAEQKRLAMTPAGPDWQVAVAVTAVADGQLPADAGLSVEPARREVSVTLPGTPTIAMCAATVQRVLQACLSRGLVPDVAVPRHHLHRDGTRVAVRVLPGVEPGGPAGQGRPGPVPGAVRKSVTSRAREEIRTSPIQP